MNSALYEGVVNHIRYSPIERKFHYSLFMLFLDLDELPELFDPYWFWSARSWNLAHYRRRDHMGRSSVPLAESVREWISEKTGSRPDGPIFIMTNLGYLGYRFNPVSFYFCFDSSKRSVRTIIAEINNTPWGEQYCYLLDSSQTEEKDGMKRFCFKKEFHISPFMDMGIDYEWYFSEPKENLRVHMENWGQGKKLFEANLEMARRPINSRSLTRALIKYPLMTWKVKAGIYYQALNLWLKKCPFYSHPKNRIQKGVLEDAN
jgi:DUF1365 family protein